MKRFRMEKFADTPSTYPTPVMKELFAAILANNTEKEAAAFFRDLLTMAEIKEFSNRWQMVKLLYKGESYASIAQKLKTSTTTVTRVAYWLYHGHGGYKRVARDLYTTKFKDTHRPKTILRGKRIFTQD